MKSLLDRSPSRVQKRFASFLCLLVFIPVLGTNAFPAPRQTPPNVGTWEELKRMGFPEWAISKYSYKGQAADGGSLGFYFFTEDNESFILVAANGTYLTENDIALGIEQKFFVVVGNETEKPIWFEVEKDSKNEKELIEKLETALRSATGVDSNDPGFLRIAISHIKSRKDLPDLFEDNGDVAN